MSKEDNDITKVNIPKLLKTVRGSIKKSIFYLCANIDYSVTEDLVGLSLFELQDYLTAKGKDIKEIIETDAKIRFYDDILDNQLSKIKPKPIQKMKSVIKKFKRELPAAEDVAKLFSLELDILSNSFTQDLLKIKIKELIEIRSSDFFLLINKTIKKFGTKLSKTEYKYSWQFYIEFQRLRDLLDDIMSIEEDLLKKDYNSIVVAKQNGISYDFFEEIIYNKISTLQSLLNKLESHPNKNLFDETVRFWQEQYTLLFRKLLINYCTDDIGEFKKSYFIFKQV